MSTVLPSFSDRPFVTSGTAVTPPRPGRRRRAGAVAPEPGFDRERRRAEPRRRAERHVRVGAVEVDRRCWRAAPVTVDRRRRRCSTARRRCRSASARRCPAPRSWPSSPTSFGCAKVTVPGPLTLLHVVIGSPPGWPSSVTVPASDSRHRGQDDLIGPGVDDRRQVGERPARPGSRPNRWRSARRRSP